jgi:hypothetical protein
VKVDVDSTSRPERVSHHRLYVSDVMVRVCEDDRALVFADRIEVHHPRGWMGVAARFLYEIDSRVYPTFEARAEHAHQLALSSFPANKMISVVLLGTGQTPHK